MVKVRSIALVATILLLAPEKVRSDEPTEFMHPFAVIFNNATIDPALRAEWDHALKFVQEKSPREPDSVKPHSTGFELLVNDHPNIQFATGNAHFVTASGVHVYCRFITVPDQTRFEAFVESVRASRGGGSCRTINEGDGKLRLTAPPRKFERDGAAFEESYGDLYFRYCDGLLLTGGKHIFHLNMKDVIDLIPEARNHHFFWKIMPPHSNPHARRVYLETYLLGLSTLMQQRDGESKEPYAFRRAVQEFKASILTGLCDDVSEIVVTHHIPQSESGFEFHCQVSIREGSKLARMLGQLRSPRHSPEGFPESSVLCGFIDIGLPEEFRTFLRAAVDLFIPEQSAFREALHARIAAGELYAHGYLATNEHQPYVRLSTPFDIELTSSEFVLALQGLFPLSKDGNTVLPFGRWDRNFGLNEYPLAGESTDGRLNLTLGPVPLADEQPFKTQVKVPRPALFSVVADFSSWASTEQGSVERAFVQSIERQFSESTLRNDPLIRRMIAPPPATFKSLVSKIDSVNPLTASLKVDSSGDGTVFVVDLEVAPHLYWLWQARNAMNKQQRNAVLGLPDPGN